jgi:CRISPR-associated Csx10 family RAMP protein
MILKTLSPLALSSTLSGNINITLDYIPGTSIRGALANMFRAVYDMGDSNKCALFKRLFLSNKVLFGNFYKESSFPIPLTARACKIKGGFQNISPDEFKEDRHGVKDFLLEYLLYKISGGTHSPQDECSINGCKAPMEHYPGWCTYSSRNDIYKGVNVRKREITRTEILPAVQTSREGILFTIEVIEAEQRFQGSIYVNDKDLENELKSLLEQQNIFLGVGKTRGLGALKVVQHDLKSEPYESLRIKKENKQPGRLDSLNTAIQRKLNNHSNNKTYFTITLLSDMILENNFMQYLTVLDIDKLKELFESESKEYSLLSNFELCLTFANSHIISGWSDVWKLPKHSELSIDKGSVFLFESNRALNSVEEHTLENTLEYLESCQFGKRRNEGLGHISICNSFHWREIV